MDSIRVWRTTAGDGLTYTMVGWQAQLSSVYVSDGRPRTIVYRNDVAGRVIVRQESDNNASQRDPKEIWYRFAGRQMGHVTNNGTLETDYAASVGSRQATAGTGAFRNGATSASPHADFDQSLRAINSYSQGGTGSYTARQGETLSSIAANLWGDSSLWYKLAQANGLSAPEQVYEGQMLTVPAGVMKSHHSASTFRPYDPADAIGDTSPTT